MGNLKRVDLQFIKRQSRQGLKLECRDMKRIDIDNCTIENSIFSFCCFDRASVACVRVKGCSFQNCQFKNIDLCGCNFMDCTFQNCDFSLAELSDNIFCSTNFIHTDFTGAALRENEFIQTEFKIVSLRGSGTVQNTFRNCNICKSEFGNCTINYNILESCNFYRSYLNVEMLATCFGVYPESLHDCELLGLGKSHPEYNLKTLRNLVREHFTNMGQYFEVFLLDLNYSLNNLMLGTSNLCNKMYEDVLRGDNIQSVQLTFLFNVFKELYKRGELGYLVLHELREGIQSILETLPTTEKSYEKFVLLYNNLSLLKNSMAGDLSEVTDWDIYNIDRPVVVRFHFQEKPSESLVNLLTQCYVYTFDHLPEQMPIILSEECGSYIAVIQTTVYTLLAFRLCSYLLVGTVKDIIKLRANMSLLASKKLPRKYYLEATKLETNITIPQAIAALLTGLIKKTLPQALQNMPVQDLNKENLREIIEISKEDAPVGT